MDVKIQCPLGAKCEEARDGAIHRCAWYANVRGTDKNTGNEIDEWRCAMNWLPMLIIENSGMQRETNKSIQSFRNEMVESNKTTHQVLVGVASHRMLRDIND